MEIPFEFDPKFQFDNFKNITLGYSFTDESDKELLDVQFVDSRYGKAKKYDSYDCSKFVYSKIMKSDRRILPDNLRI